jgi:long-subunit acyl-CoA synthetase (AMP-forming)
MWHGRAAPFYRINAPTAPKPGSIGRPLPGVSMRLVDEHGRDVPPGEIGEILLKSKALMVGYWQDPEATAAALWEWAAGFGPPANELRTAR